MEVVTYRMVAMTYDGTNSAAVAAFINNDSPAGPGGDVWTIHGEVGGVLVIDPSTSAWDRLTINVGDRVILPTMQVVSPEAFALRYATLSGA